MATEPDDQTRALPAGAESVPDEETFALAPTVEQDVVDALAEAEPERVKELVAPLHYSDMADLLERLRPEDRRTLVRYISDDFDPDILAELDDTVREEIFTYFRPEQLALALTQLDTDDAVAVIEELDEADQKEILDAIPTEERTLIEESLSYPEDSAGRLMQHDFVAVPSFWTSDQTIGFVRGGVDYDGDPLPETFYDIYVVDPAHRPLGTVPLALLVRTAGDKSLTEIMQTGLEAIPATTDQEEVAFLFRQRDLVSAPVVDDAGRLVGVVTIDDVVDVIDEENEEDLMLLAGVRETDLYSAVLDTTKARSTWLLVNLGTAFFSSTIIGLFEGTIEKIVALAALMPIVASIGGNAGTQTLTVAVRALATKELTPTNARRVIGKEFLVGCINGLAFAVLVGSFAWAVYGKPQIGAVIGAAMVVNLVVAGLAGSTVPLLLNRFKIDPAVASSVFLTMLTDSIGFFAFLGLATLFLL
ncbi:MAG: magnesium transporter [Magnetospirillum sp. WYHS-4]